MKDFFKQLFEYNQGVNQKLGSILISNSDKTLDRAIKLYSHILNAHKIWNNRIDPGDTPPGVWQIHPITDFLQIDKTNYEHTLMIIEKFDLSYTIHYPQIRGRPFNKTVGEILFNVINHSTYHKGQLATEFRQIGIEPLLTDYIFYEKA